MRKEQLCWTCKNAYAHKCTWVSKHCVPNGAQVVKSKLYCDSFQIVGCPNYETDKFSSCSNVSKLSKQYGVSERTIWRWLRSGKIKQV